MSLLHTFQQYFFMAAGDWADNLTEAICAHTAQHGVLHEHLLQYMLDGSFKGTSVELDPHAAQLKATSVELDPHAAQLKASLRLPTSHVPGAGRNVGEASPTRPEASPRRPEGLSSAADGSAAQQLSGSHNAVLDIDGSQLRALEAVQLSLDVEWPLSLVITKVQAFLVLQNCAHTMYSDVGAYLRHKSGLAVFTCAAAADNLW